MKDNNKMKTPKYEINSGHDLTDGYATAWLEIDGKCYYEQCGIIESNHENSRDASVSVLVGAGIALNTDGCDPIDIGDEGCCVSIDDIDPAIKDAIISAAKAECEELETEVKKGRVNEIMSNYEGCFFVVQSPRGFANEITVYAFGKEEDAISAVDEWTCDDGTPSATHIEPDELRCELESQQPGTHCNPEADYTPVKYS
jgi:hypothetical protein